MSFAVKVWAQVFAIAIGVGIALGAVFGGQAYMTGANDLPFWSMLVIGAASGALSIFCYRLIVKKTARPDRPKQSTGDMGL